MPTRTNSQATFLTTRLRLQRLQVAPKMNQERMQLNGRSLTSLQLCNIFWFSELQANLTRWTARSGARSGQVRLVARNQGRLYFEWVEPCRKVLAPYRERYARLHRDDTQDLPCSQGGLERFAGIFPRHTPVKRE